MSAQVTRRGGLDMQVCVPRAWTDDQVLAFAERENPCGTEGGWHIRREGDKHLLGDDERAQCLHRAAYVHIVLDA